MTPRFMSASVFLLGAFNLPFCSGILVPDRVASLSAVRAVSEKTAEVQAKQAKCEELGQKPVAFEEERAIGGAVAVAFANRAEKHLLLDVPAGASAQSLKNPKAVQVPKGDKRELNRYLNLVGKNLAAYSTRPGLAWTFAVLDDPSANAFSAPGGYVFVTRGLLAKLDNEAQLAAVLAHEVGHVTEKHALKLYASVKGTQCSAAVAGGVVADIGKAAAGAVDLNSGFGQMLASSTGFLDLDHLTGEAIAHVADAAIEKIQGGNSADDEYAADSIAVRLVVSAGYNPGEYTKLIASLPESSGMFAKHPKNADRLKNIQATLAELAPTTDNFGYADVKSFPAVAFHDELKAVR